MCVCVCVCVCECVCVCVCVCIYIRIYIYIVYVYIYISMSFYRSVCAGYSVRHVRCRVVCALRWYLCARVTARDALLIALARWCSLMLICVCARRPDCDYPKRFACAHGGTWPSVCFSVHLATGLGVGASANQVVRLGLWMWCAAGPTLTPTLAPTRSPTHLPTPSPTSSLSPLRP